MDYEAKREQLAQQNDARRAQENAGSGQNSTNPQTAPIGISPQQMTEEKAEAEQAELSQKTYGYTNAEDIEVMPEVEWNDANKQTFLMESQAAGRTMQQMKDQVRDTWDEPLEASIIKLAKQNGGDPYKVLEAFGVDTKSIKKGTSRAMRYSDGVSGLFAEVLNGIGLEDMDAKWDETDGNAIDTIANRDRNEKIYKALESTVNPDGTINEAFNIAGGVGEAMPYLATGVGSSIIRGMPVMGQLLADFVVAQGIDTARLNSAKGDIEQYGYNTAANVLGFGIGKWLSPSKNAELEQLQKNIGGLSEEQTVAIVNGMNEAEKAGVRLFGSDIDPSTATAQLMAAMEKNPATARALQIATEKDVKALLEYVSSVRASMSEFTAGTEQTATALKTTLDAKEQALTSQIDEAYDALGSIQNGNTATIPNNTFVNWADNVIGKITNEELVSGPGLNIIKTYMENLKAIKQQNGRAVGLQDMYQSMRDVVGEISRHNAIQGGGPDSRAFAKLAEIFEQQFDNMVPPGLVGDLADVTSQAKSLYKRRLDTFGYRGTGRGADGEGFIPKLMKKLDEGHTDAALDLIKTADQVKQLKEHLGDSVVNTLKRNRLNKLIKKTDGEIDLLGSARNIDSMNPQMGRELYGDQYDTIKGLGKVLKWVGKRQKSLSNPNILGIQGMFKSFTTGGLSGIVSGMKHILGAVMGGKGLTTKSAMAAQTMKAEMEQALGMPIEHFLKQIDEIIPADFRQSDAETFNAPDSVPNTHQVNSATAERNSQTVAPEQGLTPRQVEQQANQRYNLSLQSTSREMRLRTVPTEMRKEYDVIRRDLASARQEHDSVAIDNATKAMEEFKTRVQELPKRGDDPTPPNGGGQPSTTAVDFLVESNTAKARQLAESNTKVAKLQKKIAKLKARQASAQQSGVSDDALVEEIASAEAQAAEFDWASSLKGGTKDNPANTAEDVLTSIEVNGKAFTEAGPITQMPATEGGVYVLKVADEADRDMVDAIVQAMSDAEKTIEIRYGGQSARINSTVSEEGFTTRMNGVLRGLGGDNAQTPSSPLNVREHVDLNGSYTSPGAGVYSRGDYSTELTLVPKNNADTATVISSIKGQLSEGQDVTINNITIPASSSSDVVERVVRRVLGVDTTPTGNNTIAISGGRTVITLPDSGRSHLDTLTDIDNVLLERPVVTVNVGGRTTAITRGMSPNRRGRALRELLTEETPSGRQTIPVVDSPDGLRDAIANGGRARMEAGQISEQDGVLHLVVDEGASEDAIKQAADAMMRRSMESDILIKNGNTETIMRGTMGSERLRELLREVVGTPSGRTQGTPVNRNNVGRVSSAMRDRQTITYDNGATAQFDEASGQYTVTTSASSSRGEIDKAVADILSEQSNVVLTSSRGNVQDVLSSTRSRDIQDFIATNQNTNSRPSSSSGQATRTQANNKSTSFTAVDTTPPRESTTHISPSVTLNSSQTIEGVGKVEYSSIKAKTYSGDRRTKVVLTARQRGVDKAKVYEMVDAFVNGGNVANKSYALEVKLDNGKGFIFNPNQSIAHRMKELGFPPPSGTSVTAPRHSVSGRAQLSDNRASAFSEAVDRFKETIETKIGKVSINRLGDHAMEVQDINGNYLGKFTVNSSGKVGADTTGMTRGSGEGQRIYKAMWDALEGTGMYYQASGGLSSINKYRMSANMIEYMAKRGGRPAPHVRMNAVQQGASYDLSEKTLTTETALELMEGYKDAIKRAVDYNGNIHVDLDGTTTDADLKKIAKQLGRDNKTATGYNTLKMIRRFLQSGDLKSYSLSLMALLGMAEFTDMIKKGEEGL